MTADHQQDGRRGRALNYFARGTAYAPVVVTVLVLLVQTFAPKLFESLPLQVTSAIIAVAVITLAWHVETTLIAARRTLDTLEQRVAALESTQSRFINATTSLSQAKLGAALATVCNEAPRIAHLRVFAISSQQILSFIKHHDVWIERCDLLVRGFGEHDVAHRDFRSQVRLVVADWHQMQRAGRIGTLTVRHYDFHPTEYECIFDRGYLVLGLYDSDPEDYSGVRVRDPVLVRGTSDAGRLVIGEFASRFDNLFRTCLDQHGPNSLD